MEQAPSYIQWRSKTGQATPTMKLPGKPPWDIEGYPPLPADLNKTIIYATGLTTMVKHPDAASALAKYLTLPSAAPVIEKNGMSPI